MSKQDQSRYGGRSAGREVSVLRRKRDARAIDYRHFRFKPILLRGQRFHPDASFWREAKVDDEKLMTNDTVDCLQSRTISDLQGRSRFQCFMEQDGSIQGFLEVLKMPYVGCKNFGSF